MCVLGSQKGDFHMGHLKKRVTRHEKEALSEERIEALFPEMTRSSDLQIAVSLKPAIFFLNTWLPCSETVVHRSQR